MPISGHGGASGATHAGATFGKVPRSSASKVATTRAPLSAGVTMRRTSTVSQIKTYSPVPRVAIPISNYSTLKGVAIKPAQPRVGPDHQGLSVSRGITARGIIRH